MKRASANIWWVIIGAAIALVVLVVLIVTFTKGTNPVVQGLSDCESKGGICTLQTCPQGTIKTSVFSCSEQATCCLGIPKGCESNDDCGSRECQSYGDGEWYCQ
jgi:hypothetical protein